MAHSTLEQVLSHHTLQWTADSSAFADAVELCGWCSAMVQAGLSRGLLDASAVLAFHHQAKHRCIVRQATISLG